VTANWVPLPAQVPRHLTRAVIGREQKLFINQTHQLQIQQALAFQIVVPA
jgi:hypothetical protein